MSRTDWEVVTKIDSFDPTTSTGRGYERTGIQLWQDNDHYVAIGAISNIEAIITRKGAKLKRNLSAPSGVRPSFTSNFKVSARVCRLPRYPTRLGPTRTCI